MRTNKMTGIDLQIHASIDSKIAVILRETTEDIEEEMEEAINVRLGEATDVGMEEEVTTQQPMEGDSEMGTKVREDTPTITPTIIEMVEDVSMEPVTTVVFTDTRKGTAANHHRTRVITMLFAPH